MAIPTYEDAMLPVLQSLQGGAAKHVKDIRESVVRHFQLPETDINEMLPSGRVTVLQSRCGWAITYLFQARLIERTSRATYRITSRGRTVLDGHPVALNNKVLKEFPEFAEFLRKTKPDNGSISNEASADETTVNAVEAQSQTPSEMITSGYQMIRKSLVEDLLARIHENSPTFFERLVVELLVAMGYGGVYGEAIQAVGQSGDGGIDGIIKEDRLGLDFIYVQAKRWSKQVGSPEVQQFAGSLMGRNAAKGVFITTSEFTAPARSYAKQIQTRIVLIDGKMLANLMIDHGVGVINEQTIIIQKLDEDYFEES